MLEDTIVAIATPPGSGGVAMIRLSGPKALLISKEIFQSKNQNFRPNVLSYGKVTDENNQTIDDGYLVYFQAPHSFTGEDVVELQLHGSPIVLNQIITLLLEKGARLAQAGEFTKRAFLNNKMDLIQAESVAELIHAQSMMEATMARRRLDGKLSGHILELRQNAIEVLAQLEADVDFPEEDIERSTLEKLLLNMDQILTKAQTILSTYQQNEKIRSGFRVAFVGRTNVGKSSLFNQLLDQDRSIVTDIEGTTRDIISEEIMIRGYRVRLIDTAGLRTQTQDRIEQEGMKRSLDQLTKADLICMVADSTSALDQDLLNTLEPFPNKWLLWNKIDLKPHHEKNENFEKTYFISAKTGQGIQDFLSGLQEKVINQNAIECGGGVSNDRQKELLQICIEQIQLSKQLLLDKQSPEFIAFEFRKSYQALNQLLGMDEDMEEVLSHIFSKFCIGK